MSTALGWHPEHLSAVLHGQPTPAVPAAVEDHTWARTVDQRLADLQDDITAIAAHLGAR